MSVLMTLWSFFLHVGVWLILAVPLLFYPFLYFFQERLLFYPRSLTPEAEQLLQKRAPQGAIHLQAEDGTSLHGWLLHPAQPDRLPLLIYWGGNAEEVSGFMLDDALQFPGWAVLSFNYRGYGKSAGRPGEQALFADARLILDWARQQPGIDPERIVVMGRSLGSGVAVHVAAERRVAGVCLVSPYDSIRSVAQRVYPLVPVRWLLKHPFDSLARAPAISAPLLTLMADQDTVIPRSHSMKLVAAWGGPHQERVFSGEDHNTIPSAAGYYEAIRAFLQTVSGKEQS